MKQQSMLLIGVYICNCFKKLNTWASSNPEIPFPGICSWTCVLEVMHRNVHSSIICYFKTLKITQIFTDKRMNKFIIKIYIKYTVVNEYFAAKWNEMNES